MENTQEKSADIIAEMRHGFDQSWHDIDREWAYGLADRLEAALKREREDTPGNAAAMREALENVRFHLPYFLQYMRLRWKVAETGGYYERILEVVNAALAAPPRNCDRFGGDYKMLHTAWFDWTCSPSGTNPDGTVKLTFGEWLLEKCEVRHA